MSSPAPPVEAKRYPRADAIAVAKELCDALKPFCWSGRLILAGSLRRRKPTVKDIEILYVSKVTPAPADDFFKEARTLALVDHVLERLLALGTIAKRKNVNGSEMWGAKNKLAVHVASGIPVDLFAATEENWFNYLVCRTGGAENNVAICNAAIARGWKWNPYGPGFSKQTGLSNTTEVMLSERAVFEFVGLPYKEPWERT